MTQLTHLNDAGEASMVDITTKPATVRVAQAQALLRMQPQTLGLILSQGLPKGDVLAVARIAAIQAAKRCSDLIPLCHPLALTKVSVDFASAGDDALRIVTECTVTGATGVEMEALTAASVGALTVYDMCKAVDRGMSIEEVRLLRKEGGRSGVWMAAEADDV